MSFTKDEIVRYFDTWEQPYKDFWDLDHSLAMHLGFWEKSVSNLRQALQRQNEVMADMAGISRGARILDAGCGRGSSSLFLAERYECRVTGVSLSARQCSKARDSAEARRLNGSPRFVAADFHRTPFADGRFDVVWALESSCYSSDKRAFLADAYRVLRPGGTLIVADGFAVSDHPTPREAARLRRTFDGFAVEALAPIGQFQRDAEDLGFRNCRVTDVTALVMPSSFRLFLLSLPAMVWAAGQRLLRLITPMQARHSVTLFHQYVGLKRGLWQYAVFMAEK